MSVAKMPVRNGRIDASPSPPLDANMGGVAPQLEAFVREMERQYALEIIRMEGGFKEGCR